MNEKIWVALVLLFFVVAYLFYKKRTLKKGLEERIKKNAVKLPNLSWTDRKGNIHAEEVVLKRSKMPLVGDWARIYPPINENGKVNWLNAIFGGKKNFIKILLFLILVGMFLYGYWQVFHSFELYRQSCVQIIQP